MKCHHPLLASYICSSDGSPMYRVSGLYLGRKNHPLDKIVPCGSCIACRLNKASDWAARMILELDVAGSALFLTLTYDDEHLPVVESDGELLGSLRKADCQLFLKRLRKRFSDLKIRYYISGEYGGRTHRPHYHAIVFGLGLDDFSDVEVWSKNSFNQFYYHSILLDKIWKNGNVIIGNVSRETCAYCARYTLKKQYGASNSYWYRGRLPEFALMSRRPGLGVPWLELHKEFFEDANRVFYLPNLNGCSSSTKVYTPKIFMDKLRLTSPELYDSIKSVSSRFAEYAYHAEVSNTDVPDILYGSVKDLAVSSKLSAYNNNMEV